MRPKQYRHAWNPDQSYLFPPRASDWLPDDHLVYFVRDVLTELDVEPIEAAIHAKDPRGNRPYDPRVMLGLLIYGYCVGIHSSRRLERASYEDVAFRIIAGDCHPHFTTINEFRRTHRAAFTALFLGVLRLCQATGMVELGHIALDGSKLKASASKHKAMSYEGLSKAEQRLLVEINAMLERSEEEDQAEDVRYGTGRRANELPEGLRRKQDRLERIRQAKASMEEDARRVRAAVLRENAAGQREKASTEENPSERRRQRTRAAQSEAKADELDPPDPDGPNDPPSSSPTALPRHRVNPRADGTPKPNVQHNFTDPESVLMVTKGSFQQSYNGQLAVDEAHQVIVAADVTNQATDAGCFTPMLIQVGHNCGQLPETATADTGYWRTDAIEDADRMGVNALIALQRSKREERGAATGIGPSDKPLVPRELMRHRLDMAPNRDLYRRRKSTVEPVFGQIKAAMGFREFSFRGLEAVRGEWQLVTLCHNLLKLFRHRGRHALG